MSNCIGGKGQDRKKKEQKRVKPGKEQRPTKEK